MLESVNSRCPGRSRFAVIDALNAEWEDLHRDRSLSAQTRSDIARWAHDHPLLSGCRTAADVLSAIRSDPDPVLAVLIDIHQAFRLSSGGAPVADHLAGRIVLQTMLGKIVAMARRDLRHAVEDYVGQFWLRIASYPLARRPRRIAANLALDTLKAVIRDSADASASTVPVTVAELELAGLGYPAPRLTATRGLPGSADSQIADLTAHRVLRTAHELGLVDEPTCRLLLSVYADGLSSADAAARHGLSPTTVRFRCSKAIRELARHALSIAEAA